MNLLRTLILALALAASADEAGAHASLVSASPADGALLVASPNQVILGFDEAVQLLDLRLVDDTGTVFPLSAGAHTEGATIRTTLPPALRNGTYVLSFRVTSTDAHPVGGSIAFSIGQITSEFHAARSISAVPMADVMRNAVRALRDVAMLIAAGGALFLLCIASFPGQRAVLVSAGIAAGVFSLAGIGLHGVAVIGHGVITDAAPWRAALSSSFGLSGQVATAAALTIAVAALLRRGALRNVLLALGALASVSSLSLTGHAAAVHSAAAARPALVAHGLAAAFWFGSLIALFALLRSDSEHAIAAVARFSRYAVVAVTLLIVAGAGFAAIQLTSAEDMLTTQYGKLILVKVSLLAGLLALAARNRFSLTPRLERVGSGAVRALRRSIAAEIVLIATVIAITAVLVHTQPRSAPIVKTLDTGTRVATLTVTPGHAGSNVVIVLFRNAEGRPFDPVEATFELSNPGAGVETMSRTLARVAPGEYRHDGSDIAFPGSWRLELRARIGDFEQVSWTTTIDVR